MMKTILVMKSILVLLALSAAVAGCATSASDVRPGGAATVAVPEPVSPIDELPIFMAALQRNRQRIQDAKLELTRIEQHADNLRRYDEALNAERLQQP